MSHVAGLCCLVVEDEVLVGMDLEDGLREAGFDVRWVASAESALAVLRTTSPDVALLDVIVRAKPCTALASELRRRNIPFLVYSGCPRMEGPEEFWEVPWLAKPADMNSITSVLTDMLDISVTRPTGLSGPTMRRSSPQKACEPSAGRQWRTV